MSRVCGVCCGLIVFSGMIVCGMLAENPVQTTVERALVGLLGGYVLGSLSGWIGLFVVRESAATPDGDPAVSPDGADRAVNAQDQAPKQAGP